MGGGTPIPPPTRRTRAEAEKIVSAALEQALDLEIRYVFVSYCSEDEDFVLKLLKGVEDNQFKIKFVYYPVINEFNEKYKSECSERISETVAIIVMIGANTAECQECIWQIEESINQEKTLVGVKLNEDQDDPIPQLLIEQQCPIIIWNLARISKLI